MDRVAEQLRQQTHAEVRFDRPSRLLYATDASLYEIEPVGVVIPRRREDVAAAMAIASEEGVAIVPRGGATSLSGQTIGRAIVIDASKYLNRIGTVDRDRMTVKVEPGVVLDQLNAHLRPMGLMVGPDVSTSDRATIGGMIGNNSAGARSLRYGKMVDHVESVDVVLDDGERATFRGLDSEELERVMAAGDRVGALHRVVSETVETHRAAIEERFPHILRRVSGYNLDEFVPGLPVRARGWVDWPWRFNLAKLVVGAEGTLAFVEQAELKVVAAPKFQGLVVLSFATIRASLDHVNEMLEFDPIAVEMLDRMILDLAAGNPEFAKSLTFAEGRPEAVLAAQFYADSAEELAGRAEGLAARFRGRAGVLGIRLSLSNAAKDDFWKIRKAGLSLLMGMVGDAKPVAFVEDTAVAVEKLPAFYDEFAKVVARHGTSAACYGHADVGCLHIRPILNMKDERGVESLRAIAREISDLVKAYGGAMSGEHGDGLARSLWNRKLFGEEVYGAFQTIKRAFDPTNRLNPDKVVGEADPGKDLRIGPGYLAQEPVSTAYDYSEQGGFARAVEMCSGVGACRKPTGGTMCPSYMVTREEEHSTRGRANLLRQVMSGKLGHDSLEDPALDAALDLCLQCKACKTECPSNVDMAKLKSEYLYQKYRKTPAPIASVLMANIRRLYALGSATAPLSNWMAGTELAQWFQATFLGIDGRRTLPRFEREHLRRWFRKRTPNAKAGERGRVVFLDDCFTTYNEPRTGRAAIEALEAAGYRVELAGVGCCGRPAFSKGLLDEAKRMARENVERLAPLARAGVPILGVEPSCLLTLVDEYRDLRLGPDAEHVARSSLMIEQFLADPARVPEAPAAERPARFLLHGHCQQKALVGIEPTVAMLGRLRGVEVKTLDSGCCGMAGSFGYETGHYELSEALARRVLLPAVDADPGAELLAPGFSCRSQVHSLEDVVARHPVEIWRERL